MSTSSLPNWQELVRLHQDYDGKIIDFCRVHKINKNSFYYYRKKFKGTGYVNSPSTSFQKIEVNQSTSTTITNLSKSTMITVNVGEATINIPDTINSNTLITIMKALSSC